MDMQFTVNLNNGTLDVIGQSIQVSCPDSDTAVQSVLKEQDVDFFDAFHSVYQDNPVPNVSSKYGAPMGRMSRPLDHDHHERYNAWKADRIDIDEGGYDDGGCYWGLRPIGQSIYAVQDGCGNIAFVDATSPNEAIKTALQN